MAKGKTAATESTDTTEPAKLHRVEVVIHGPEGLIERGVSAPLTEEDATKLYADAKGPILST